MERFPFARLGGRKLAFKLKIITKFKYLNTNVKPIRFPKTL